MSIVVLRTASGPRIKLPAFLDDQSERQILGLARSLQAPDITVLLDCSEVGLIDSASARRWCALLDALIHIVPVRLNDCSPAFVQFALLLPAIMGKAPIVSFLVPYECKVCNCVVEHKRTAVDAGFRALCPRCAHEMESYHPLITGESSASLR